MLPTADSKSLISVLRKWIILNGYFKHQCSNCFDSGIDISRFKCKFSNKKALNINGLFDRFDGAGQTCCGQCGARSNGKIR